MGEPAAADVDGDGTVDVIAVFASFDDPHAIAARPDDPTGAASTIMPPASTAGRRVATAVSGRSGKWLWNHLLDRKSRDRVHERLSDRGPTVLSNRAGKTMTIVSGSQWVALDAATGRPRVGPTDLGFEPIRPVQYADLDGDGTVEMLALGPIPMQGLVLAAFSMATGAKLWSKPVLSAYNVQFASVPGHWSEPVQGDTRPGFYGPTAPGLLAEWPVVADLDGDGRAEVVLGYCGPKWPSADQGGVEMLDGTTGRTRWVRPLWASASDPTLLKHMIAGPDIDGDGVNDLVAISRFEGRSLLERQTVAGRMVPRQIYVDALSGKDGQMLWSWHKNMDEASAPILWPARFWGRGPDGRPFLAVPIGGNLRAATIQPAPRDHPDAPIVHLLSSSTGEEAHTIPGLSWPNVADLDGDGLDDLWGSVEGKLHAFRGEVPETWRALGEYLPAADLDGDGKGDVLSVESSRRPGDRYSKIESDFAVARSGEDGRLLWRARVSPPPSDSSNFDKFKSIPMAGQPDEHFLSRYVVGTRALPEGDLDGDGTPDVLVTTTNSSSSNCRPRGISDILPVQLLSGRTGRRIWAVYGRMNVKGFVVRSAGRKEPPDLFVLQFSPLVYNTVEVSGTTRAELAHVTRISSRDGRILWDYPFFRETAVATKGPEGFSLQVGDLDGDGELDLVLPIVHGNPGSRSVVLRAISLRDGKPTRTRPYRVEDLLSSGFMAGDLDGDGRAEVVPKDVRGEGPPLLAGSDGTTARRTPLAAAGAGAYAQASGNAVRPAYRVDRNDSRWRRPLPWLIPEEAWPIHLEMGLLAFFNIAVPLTIVRLAARKRPYFVRLLLALPLSGGILWATFLCTTKSPNSSLDDPATWFALAMFAVRSLVGVPFMAYAWLVARCFIRPRRARVAWLAGSTALFSLVFAIMQLRADMKLMIAPEYYSWWGWYEIALPGAVAVACLALFAWPIMSAIQLARRLRHRAVVAASMP